MTLTINETNYDIVRFNLSIGTYRDDTRTLENNVSIDFTLDYDIETIGTKIATEFEGDFTITTGSKVYNFTGYTFEDINLNVGLGEDRISLRLSKPVA